MSKTLTALRRRATSEVGAAMVEVAIVLPLLNALVLEHQVIDVAASSATRQTNHRRNAPSPDRSRIPGSSPHDHL